MSRAKPLPVWCGQLELYSGFKTTPLPRLPHRAGPTTGRTMRPGAALHHGSLYHTMGKIRLAAPARVTRTRACPPRRPLLLVPGAGHTHRPRQRASVHVASGDGRVSFLVPIYTHPCMLHAMLAAIQHALHTADFLQAANPATLRDEDGGAANADAATDASSQQTKQQEQQNQQQEEEVEQQQQQQQRQAPQLPSSGQLATPGGTTAGSIIQMEQQQQQQQQREEEEEEEVDEEEEEVEQQQQSEAALVAQWKAWCRHFAAADEAGCAADDVSAELTAAVAAEDYATAAALKARAQVLAAGDAVAAVRRQLAEALREERYEDAATLRDAGWASLQGWWACMSPSNPAGHLLHVTPE
jgi:flagellar biosynthesis GTPase FlhF